MWALHYIESNEVSDTIPLKLIDLNLPPLWTYSGQSHRDHLQICLSKGIWSLYQILSKYHCEGMGRARMEGGPMSGLHTNKMTMTKVKPRMHKIVTYNKASFIKCRSIAKQTYNVLWCSLDSRLHISPPKPIMSE